MDENYILVYEVTSDVFGYQLFLLLFFCILLVPISLFFAAIGLRIINGIRNRKDFRKKVFFSKLHLVITLFLFITTLTFTNFFHTNWLYYNGHFDIVEGKIQNFVPMPKEGHALESFTVDGVFFEYGNFNETYHGFNNAASHGGPITHNGQQVRLGYLAKSNINIIVKIEVLK